MEAKDDLAKQVCLGGSAVGAIGAYPDPVGGGILLSRTEHSPFIAGDRREFTRNRSQIPAFRESPSPSARAAVRCNLAEVRRYDCPRSEPEYCAWNPESRSRLRSSPGASRCP